MNLPKQLTTVTTFSKILAMILFITLPFVGFWAGIRYQQYVTQVEYSDVLGVSIEESCAMLPWLLAFLVIFIAAIVGCLTLLIGLVYFFFKRKLLNSKKYWLKFAKIIVINVLIAGLALVVINISGSKGFSCKTSVVPPQDFDFKINVPSDNPADWNVHQGRGYQVSYPKNATIKEIDNSADNSTDKMYLSDVLIISINNKKTESETIQEYADESWMTGFETLNGNTAMYYYNDQPGLVVSNIVYFLINDKTLYTIVLPVLEDQNITTQQQILNTFTFTNELACTQNSECVAYKTDTCCGIGVINKDFLGFRPKYQPVCARVCPTEKISAVCKSNTCVLEYE